MNFTFSYDNDLCMWHITFGKTIIASVGSGVVAENMVELLNASLVSALVKRIVATQQSSNSA